MYHHILYLVWLYLVHGSLSESFRDGQDADVGGPSAWEPGFDQLLGLVSFHRYAVDTKGPSRPKSTP